MSRCAFASTLGDVQLAWRSIKANLVGVAIAFTMAYAFVIIFGLKTDTHEIMSRTEVGASDIALALAAGCAGPGLGLDMEKSGSTRRRFIRTG